jgi:zinc protease
MSGWLPWLAGGALLAAARLGGQEPARAGAPPAVDLPVIKYERLTLANGLVVILQESHMAPVVTVDVWYHVGSKNETAGRTGLAHLFEHMMFEGSANVEPGQHRIIIQSIGGVFNQVTTEDRTSYYATVPSNHLETMLWLESDRMATLLTRVDQTRLDAEREIVKNERRTTVENQPFGLANEITITSLFPPDYPYGWPVMGSMTDLSAASLDDVRTFFRTYYAPNNATLVITGDFKPADAKRLAEKYFGPIPRGPAVIRPSMPSIALPDEKRLVLEDARSRTAQFRVAWPTIGNGHRDLSALQTLASVLTLDRTSRLTKALVYDRQLAASVTAANFDFENRNAGLFQISVTPRANASLTEIERVVDSVIADLHLSPPTRRELQRARSFVNVSTVTGLQYGLTRAERLAQGEVFERNPLWFVGMLREQIRITPADVQRVAKNYLTSGRIVLSMVPAGSLDQVARPGAPFTNVTPGKTGF